MNPADVQKAISTGRCTTATKTGKSIFVYILGGKNSCKHTVAEYKQKQHAHVSFVYSIMIIILATNFPTLGHGLPLTK